jgi:hypothetical protein
VQERAEGRSPAGRHDYRHLAGRIRLRPRPGPVPAGAGLRRNDFGCRRVRRPRRRPELARCSQVFPGNRSKFNYL